MNSEARLSVNPSVALVSALILTGAVAFSRNFEFPVAMMILSLVLVILTRTPIRPWIRITLLILAWVTFVSVPLPFITPGESVINLSLSSIELRVTREGLYVMMAFISRTVSAASIFTSFSLMMGWRGIIRGLEGIRVPREITLLLNLSIIHIPLTLREASKMLSARDARIMKEIGLKDLWTMLATVVGDLLLRSYERAWRLEKAIRARSFESAGAVSRTFHS